MESRRDSKHDSGISRSQCNTDLREQRTHYFQRRPPRVLTQEIWKCPHLATIPNLMFVCGRELPFRILTCLPWTPWMSIRCENPKQGKATRSRYTCRWREYHKLAFILHVYVRTTNPAPDRQILICQNPNLFTSHAADALIIADIFGLF